MTLICNLSINTIFNPLIRGTAIKNLTNIILISITLIRRNHLFTRLRRFTLCCSKITKSTRIILEHIENHALHGFLSFSIATLDSREESFTV